MLDNTLMMHRESMSRLLENSGNIDVNLDSDSNLKKDLDDMNKNIIEGKNRLTSEINSYVQMLYENQIHNEKKKIYHNDFRTIDNILISVTNLCRGYGLDMDSIQENLDNITYSIENIKQKLDNKVNKEINEIDEQIKRSEYIIHSLGDAFSIFKSTSFTYLCSICLTNNIDVYVDCGHTYCSSCIKNNFCYICRKRVAKVNKLYFSL